MKEADVVVAGAGVAGCLAARDLARKGHSVVLLEKHAAGKLGHDWWDTVEKDIFDKVDLQLPKPPELVRGYDFTLYSPFGKTGMNASMPPSKLNIDRKLFAKRLVSGAREAGAELIERASVEGPVLEGGRVVGVSVKYKDGTSETIRSKICLDATGCSATLRSKMPEKYGFNNELKGEEYMVGYREIRNAKYSGKDSTLVVGEHEGIQWICRDQEGLVDFFACVPGKKEMKNPKEIVEEMISREDDAGGKIMRGGYGGKIPVRRGFDSFVAPGFMLAGDSACMANPLNGSGISTALLAARLAAETAHKALQAGRYDVETLWPYNVEYKKTQDVKFAKLHLLQKLIYAEPKEHFHLFLTRGIFTPDTVWDMEEKLKLKDNLERLPKMLGLIDHPLLLARIVFTFYLLNRLEKHYLDFPDRYDPRTFKAWSKRTRRLFNLVPKSGGK
ncbi:MAG: FAD-dependent oxidoreductase [bacterium]